MATRDEIKQKLNGFNSKSLCLNEGEPVFKSITEKVKTKDAVAGVINQHWNDKNPDGILITENGIEWNATMLFSQVSINGKKTTKPGNLSFKELAHYKCVQNEEILMYIFKLERQDLTDPDLLEISFNFAKDADIEQMCDIFEVLTGIENVEESIPDEKRLDYLEAFIVEDGVNPIMNFLRGLIGTDLLAYKKPFAKYAKKGSWAFYFETDASNILGWVFAPLYRKIYLWGAVFVAIDLIVGFAIGGIAGSVVMVLLMTIQSFINPFIIYKRYLGILKDCLSQKMSKEQTVETLKERGGSNGYLGIIAGIAIIVSVIVQIVSFVRGH